jgi:hypothetical protein
LKKNFFFLKVKRGKLIKLNWIKKKKKINYKGGKIKNKDFFFFLQNKKEKKIIYYTMSKMEIEESRIIRVGGNILKVESF